MTTAARALLPRIRSWIDGWFMAPEPRAAGRMGLFRIAFGLFYLWHLSVFDLSILAGMPEAYGAPMAILGGGALDLPAASLRWIDRLLVAALVLLVFGWQTRAVTAFVLVTGVFREALLAQPAVENANVFIAFYIPLFMLACGRWGETYSLDRERCRRRGGTPVDPSEDSWTHFLAARALLVILAALFTSSPLFKTLSGGTWIDEPEILSNLMLRRSVLAVSLGLPANPVAPFVAAHPPLGYAMQLGVLVFEASFFLVLFGRNLRSFFVATAMVFHSLNAIFLLVSFTPVLIVYGLYVDWEGIARRLPFPAEGAKRLLARGGAPLAWIAAVTLALSWQVGGERIFDLFGLLDWRTLWLPVFPLALGWAAVSALRIAGFGRPARGA